MPQITVNISHETSRGGIAASTQSFSNVPSFFCIRLKKDGSIKEIMIINIEPMINCARWSCELQVTFQFFLSAIAIGLATFLLLKSGSKNNNINQLLSFLKI